MTVIASFESYDETGRACLLTEEKTYFSDDGIKIIRLGYNKKFKRLAIKLKKYHGVYSLLYDEQPDIIFTHGLQFWDLTEVIRYKKKHMDVMIFADNHADYINSAHGFLSKNFLHKTLWRYKIQRAIPYIDKFFGVTPLRCDFLNDMYGIPLDKIELLPLGVDDDNIPQDRIIVRQSIREKLNLPEDAFVFFTGGKIDSKKNTDKLLQALEKLHNNRVYLIICGVITPEMEQIIIPMITDNVRYLGWCGTEVVMNCMLASDAACFPGTHSTLWEQVVGVGLPAIFKRWKNMEHINVNGNSIIIDGDNFEELYASVEKIITLDYYASIKSLAMEASNMFLYSDISKKAIGK